MPKEFKSFFKIVGGNEGSLCRYNTRLDTYGCGCSHDCQFCYAKSLLEFRGLWSPKEPSVADIDKIYKRIDTLKKKRFTGVLRLGGMTDCFQASETEHRVAYKTIKALNEARIPYLIVTKSHLIATDRYLSVLDPKLAHVQISVTNTDDAQALRYEKASLTSKRLEALKILQNFGGGQVDVSLRLSPYIESFIDKSVIAEFAPRKVLVEFLRINHWIVRWLSDVGIFDLTGYTHKHGGYQHLPLETKMRQVELLRKALLNTEISLCEDVPEHHAYWKTINPNSDDCCNLAQFV